MTRFQRQTQVLLVEDDSRLASLTGDWLEGKGISVDYASCGTDALHLASESAIDVVVLDIALPDMSGLAVCRLLREGSNGSTPIIMLSSRGTWEQTVEGLDAGADDYLTKPFSPEELLARIVALTRRRRNEVAHGAIELDGVRVDTWSGHVMRNGRMLNILPVGMQILVELMRIYPNAITKQDLSLKIWGVRAPQSDSLRSHIYQLRKHLNAGFDEPLIDTLAGAGLRFRAPRDGEEIATT